MIEVGRICVKTAGRDAGKSCIIIEVIDDNFVMVDGYTRRRKVNVKHLEPLPTVAKIKKNATHEEVVSELEKSGMKEKKKKQAGKRVKSDKPKAEKKPAVKKVTAKKK